MCMSASYKASASYIWKSYPLQTNLFGPILSQNLPTNLKDQMIN